MDALSALSPILRVPCWIQARRSGPANDSVRTEGSSLLEQRCAEIHVTNLQRLTPCQAGSGEAAISAAPQTGGEDRFDAVDLDRSPGDASTRSDPTSDFKYLSQQLVVTPLLSHAVKADRRFLGQKAGLPTPPAIRSVYDPSKGVPCPIPLL